MLDVQLETASTAVSLRPQSKRLWMGALYAVVTALALLFLGSGVVPVIKLLAMLLGVVFPAASLLVANRGAQSLSSGLRVAVGLAPVLILITPFYYLRRLIPIPVAVTDGVVIVLLSGLSIHFGSYRRWIDDLRSPLVRSLAAHLLVALPLAFAAVWTGHAVIAGGEVRYYRFIPMDYENLTNIVSLIKASPALPLSLVEGVGPLSYHWLYYTFPAWLSEFLGISTPNTIALILCNYATACLFFLVIAETAHEHLKSPRAALLASVTAGIVVYASMITYAYVMLVDRLHLPWLTARDGAFLILLKSMIFFGNNTTGLLLALLVLLLVGAWNRAPNQFVVIAGAVCLAVLPAYSATLAPSMVLGLLLVLLAGQIKHPFRALIPAVVVGVLVLAVLYAINLFGSRSSRLGIEFDRFQFLQNVVIGMLPLWVLAAASFRYRRQPILYWLMIGACLTTGSFMVIRGTTVGLGDFVQKTATLIAVLATPMAALGLESLLDEPRRIGWRVVAAGVVLFGLLNQLMFVAQFPIYRLRGGEKPTMALPRDYYQALIYVRDHTPRESIVIDPSAEICPLNIATASVGERRVLLPHPYTLEIVGLDADLSADVLQRREDFRKWEVSRYADESMSRRFAESADYLILAESAELDQNWSRQFASGDFAVYRSLVRSAH